MYLKSTFSAFLLILCFNLLAQQNHICINDQVQLKERKEINYTYVPEYLNNYSTKYVNTVVHVMYYNDADSISSEQIEVIIEDLNRLFRADGIDTSVINPVHRDKIMDSQIQFCLAKTDTEGESTTGITHTKVEVEAFPIQYSLSGIKAELVKNEFFGGVAPWDVDRYFNIWIAQVGVNNENFSYGIPRDEYYPLNGYKPANTIPGAIIDIDNFIAPPPLGTLEGLFAHECGHALGLLHTFHISGIDTVEFCDGTDFMMDTPTAAITTECDPNYAENTCNDPTDDEPDNVSNFMNYACQLMFTPDQIATMHNNLSMAPSELYEESVCEIVSSIENSKSSDKLDYNIFPNPNNGDFVIRFSEANLAKAELYIYDLMGQIVFEQNIDLNRSPSIEINSAGLNKGIYYLNVKTNRGDYSKKFVVQNN